MSGDATGFVVGGAVALAALPVVVTAGACAAAAYGVGKLLAGAAKREVRAQRTFEREPKQSLSREAMENNRRMQEALDRQAEAIQRLHNAQLSSLNAANARLLKAESSGDIKAMETALKEVRQVRRQIDTDLHKSRERIRQESMQHAELLLQEQSRLQAQAMEMLATQPQDDAARSYAADLIASAMDACSRLQEIQQSEPDPMLTMQMDQLQNSLIRAQRQMDAGRYELACIDAAQIVTVSQRLAYQAAARRMDLDSRRQWIAAELEAANAELQKAACVPVRCGSECVEEDLDAFTHGDVSRISRELTALQEKAARANAADINMLELQLDDLRGNIDQTLELGRRMLLTFYLRMELMEKVKRWATDNQYRFEWVSNENDDVTRPLAAHFVHRVTGNEFTFVLGEEKGNQQLETSLSLFFADGREMSEHEKASMRASLTDYLSREGVQNALACSGSVNCDSRRQELRTETSYRQRSRINV